MRLGVFAGVIGACLLVADVAGATYVLPPPAPGSEPIPFVQTPAAPAFGQPITLSVNWTSNIPAGTVVTFTEKGTTLGSATADGTSATESAVVHGLAVGAHTITGNFGPLPGAVTFTVAQGTTHIVMVQSGNASKPGEQVTFTATVAGEDGSAPFAEPGDIQFLDNGAPIGAAEPLVDGVASFVSAELPNGAHDITATYAGNANYAGSTSNSVLHQVSTTAGAAAGGNGSEAPSAPNGAAAGAPKKDDDGGCSVSRNRESPYSGFSTGALVGLAIAITALRGRRR